MAYQISSQVSWRELGEHTLILDTVMNKQVHHLNVTGSFIWKQIEQGLNDKEIINAVTSVFNVDASQAKQDYHEIIDQLKNKKIII